MFKVLSTSLLFVTALSHAATIPVPEDAKVFADFTKESPAVISFFTKESEQQIKQFYQSTFGQPTSSEQKYGRIQLYYEADGHLIRVIIAPQAKVNEVNVMQKKKPS